MTAPNEATRVQLSASRPDASTWLSANAGSGKTKVLTDRVARLLLDGTPPQRILCLTYTKAAATEMQNRLFRLLGGWAMAPEADLRTALAPFSEKPLTDAALSEARTLFARAIETPGGLKIQTIHSFCNALLRRFPLEAGVSPQFRDMDDGAADELITDILDAMAEGTDRPLIDGIATYAGTDLADVARSVISNRERIPLDDPSVDVGTWFGLRAGQSETEIVQEVFIGGEAEMLARIGELMLREGGKTDSANGQMLLEMARKPFTLETVIDLGNKLVFGPTAQKAGQSKFGVGFPTAGFLKKYPDAFDEFRLFAVRVVTAEPMARSCLDARRTGTLHRFACAFLPLYLARKAEYGYLDFDDMILKTRDLLSRSEVAQWVLFRLDGGIDHILVDEAQDTSLVQWQVVQQLAAEFTAGHGARDDKPRTLFVVGDKKQSIYSFQGAVPDAFDQMKDHFAARLAGGDAALQDLAMEFSFRSSKAILDATDAVFSATESRGVGQTRHAAFFDDIPGRVDLWDIVAKNDAMESQSDWEKAPDLIAPEHHHSVLARRIADFVADLLAHGSVPRKGQEPTAVRPGDILILVRNRSGLFGQVLRALKAHPSRIPVAGADRLELADELAVKDIRALLAFLAHQDDDLSLACALRSPLFGFSEADLYKLAHDRPSVSLWQELRQQRDQWPETLAVLDDLRAQADFLRPYEIIERLLVRHDGRRKLLARLGLEAEDGIDALLQQALSYEIENTPSLTGFIAWLDGKSIGIKRVLDDSSDLVRVMSTHGAKGLEAPIVILPDTMRDRPSRPKEYLVDSSDRLLWRSATERRSDHMSQTIAQQEIMDREEEDRLLYVAMTRAESWLVIAGAGEKLCHWYERALAGLEQLGAQRTDFGGFGGLRYSHGDWPARNDPESTSRQTVILPDWTSVPAAPCPAQETYLTPSDLGGAKAIWSPDMRDEDEDAMLRGLQIHALIEHLAGVPADQAKDIARHVLSEADIPAPEESLAELLDETQRVLSQTYDWAVFGSHSLAEVPFAVSMPSLGTQRMRGVIDRLIVEEDRVRIVDFKTNTVVPERAEDIPEGVLRQLGAYAEACALIYPNHRIETAVLWTRPATLMPVPPDIVMSALRRATIS